MMQKLRVGMIGCGNISAAYLKASRMFPGFAISAVADIDAERARARAAEFDVAKVYSVEDLLRDDEIDIVLNLTIPAAHAEICLAALETGHHVYTEKPLAVRFEDGQRIVREAEQRGLRVGSAPDTFLGGGLQTCRKLIDDGWIGRPIAATGFMMSGGPERWHPDPEFFFKPGAGPMFDMGPYYLTALVNLLGPVVRVTGSAQAARRERLIGSKPHFGEVIKVEVPTHVAGVLDFASGAVATLVTSFDVWHANLPWIEIYGTEGTLSVPDPNTFGGPVRLRRFDAPEWREMPLTHGFTDNSRGLGIADMARALQDGRPHRASGALALHVLELMHGFLLASEQGAHHRMATTCERPPGLPLYGGAASEIF